MANKNHGPVKEGGYSKDGRTQGDSSSGPRLVDSSSKNPVRTAQSEDNYEQKGINPVPFKSNENQKNTSNAGVQDTSSGEIQQLKRSGPATGSYQSGNENRGGQATASYDSSVDSDLEIRPGWLDEMRAHQDSAAKRASND